jgi:hypothetical protein
VPLRSVEAASRDDAIAAAREQFGPQARVVGVRRVRSGGVLGFFATERYVAEVAEPAPEAAVRPAVPAPTRVDDDVPPADFSSPLASAAPARARAAAPARNGAAAWAAEAAARSTDDIPEAARAAAAAARAARSGAPARSAAPVATPARTATPAWTASLPASVPASGPADDERVSELLGLLAAQGSEPAAPAHSRATYPRASFPRTGTVARPGNTLVDDEEETAAPVRGGGQRVLPAAAPASPSPFTAALARMVAGDQDVRQAVQEALATQPTETRPRDDAEPWPARSEAVRTAETSVAPPAARQEEETVGDQVIAPPSMTDRPVEVPTWAAAPEVAAASASPREEAIADLLRGALAQGHSDEALAGILRKLLAGASPQTALTEPETAVPAGPVFAVPTLPVPPLDVPVQVAPALDLSVLDEPALDLTALVGPVLELTAPAEPIAPSVEIAPVVAASVETVPVPAAPAETAPVVAPVIIETASPVAEIAAAPAPVVLSTTSDSMWGTPSSSAPLWGEPASAPSARAVEAEAPIWAEVVLQEPTRAPLFSAPAVSETPVVEAAVVEAAEFFEEEAGVEAVEESVAEYLEEAEVAELAPMLARTASDPAPMMSLDATTVMPPLSLLPPRPSSRGRGRPPVPPAASRFSSSSSVTASAPSPAAPATPADTAAAKKSADSLLTDAPSAGAAPAVQTPKTTMPAPATRFLATVTRLPVAPLMAGPDYPELPEDFDEFDAEEVLAAARTTTPEAPAAPTSPAAPMVIAPGDVAGRLELLGLPAELLGSTFAEDVADRGTYAALTRSLALQLPKAPELPSGSGEAVFVVGPGVDALRAARSLAAALHLDPDSVQWATRGDLAGLAPTASRVTSVDTAIDRRQASAAAGTVTIVAVDAPLRTDAYWMAQMMTVWTPAAVWAVVEATRKPEDLEPWLDGLPRVDALIVQDTDLSADPASVLRRVTAPVALLDGIRATPHRWASLLCERLESTTT